MSLSILGTGSYLPPKVVTNDDLASIVNTSDEWIRTRTGIERRHVITGQETVAGMATWAATQALEDAGLTAGDIGFILCATISGDYISPGVSSLVQAALGAECPAMDLNAGCSGFLYGLAMAEGLLAAGHAKHILLLGAEALSHLADWTDRATCVLFGDGAGAVVLGGGGGLLSLKLASQGNAAPLNIPFQSGNTPWHEGEPARTFLTMEGQDVYKFAVHAIADAIGDALAAAGVDKAGVDHVLVHQANLRIIEAAQRKTGIPLERYRVNIQEVGNTSAASIPLLLDECAKAGRFKNEDILVLCGFGAGLTSGAAVLRWGR